jgi:hypothetical protein
LSWPSSTPAQGALACELGYSDFHNLMGFTRKKMPNNILYLKMFGRKVFQLAKPFLANLHSSISEKYMYSMTSKNLFLFFAYKYQKYAE